MTEFGFPLSRLPNDLRDDVFVRVGLNDQLKFLNVTRLLRNYSLQNGPFGKDLDCELLLDLKEESREQNIKSPSFQLKIYDQMTDTELTLSVEKFQSLFKRVCTCQKFDLSSDLCQWLEAENNDQMLQEIRMIFPNLKAVLDLTEFNEVILRKLNLQVLSRATLYLKPNLEDSLFGQIKTNLSYCSEIDILDRSKLQLQMRTFYELNRLKMLHIDCYTVFDLRDKVQQMIDEGPTTWQKNLSICLSIDSGYRAEVNYNIVTSAFKESPDIINSKSNKQIVGLFHGKEKFLKTASYRQHVNESRTVLYLAALVSGVHENRGTKYTKLKVFARYGEKSQRKAEKMCKIS